VKTVFEETPQNQNVKQKKDKDETDTSPSTPVKQERTKDGPETYPSTPSTSNTEGENETPSPLPAPSTPLHEDKIKGSSSPPPEPSRDSGTPLLKESENNEAVDQQVLISAEPNIFQDKVKMKERRRVSQTILVPNLSDTMRQSAVEARNRSRQVIATSVIFALVIVTLAFISSTLLGGLKKQVIPL